MKVRFLVTNEFGHVKGQIKELDLHIAKHLIAMNLAEQVDGVENLEHKEVKEVKQVKIDERKKRVK